MLIRHRRVARTDIPVFLQSDMYTRIMNEMLAAGLARSGVLWIFCDEDEELTFQRAQVNLFSDYRQLQVPAVDALFVRGDRECHLPLLRSSQARRLFFYAASGRGIPRYWTRFHGILVDDMRHESIVRRYYPGAYIAPFMKTAVPEVFRPLAEEEKLFDVCLVGDLATARKNLPCLTDVIANLPQVKFVICGKKPDPRLAEKLGSRPGQITCPGFVPHEQLNRIYNQSKLGLLTSNESDASPRVILEFMAAGLPALANENLCGIKKFMLPEAGRIAPTADFPKLIPEMLSLRETFRPREVFEQHFSPRLVAHDFARHVRSIMLMDAEPPAPSWRGRLARITRARVDRYQTRKGSNAYQLAPRASLSPPGLASRSCRG